MAKKSTPEVNLKKAPASFEIVGVVPGPVLFQGREIDLSKITLKEARSLAARGLRYVKIIDS